MREHTGCLTRIGTKVKHYCGHVFGAGNLYNTRFLVQKCLHFVIYFAWKIISSKLNFEFWLITLLPIHVRHPIYVEHAFSEDQDVFQDEVLQKDYL